ncbi:hypothetical protein [Sinomonas atrocyanea]
MDIRTTRELALQISGIGKVVYTGSRRRQGAAEPVRASAERPQPGPGRGVAEDGDTPPQGRPPAPFPGASQAAGASR